MEITTRSATDTVVGVRRRITTLMAVGVVIVLLIGGCGVDELSNPYKDTTLEGQAEIDLIDQMRAKGSAQDAHDRLTATAAEIAEHIAAAIPGQTWKFDDDPYGQKADRQGGPCEQLTGNVAARPSADAVIFGRTFSAAEFPVALTIVQRFAAPYGATDTTWLFDDPTQRDFTVYGNDYQFRLGQIDFATLTIQGECFLKQAVLDLPPWPTSSPSAQHPPPSQRQAFEATRDNLQKTVNALPAGTVLDSIMYGHRNCENEQSGDPPQSYYNIWAVTLPAAADPSAIIQQAGDTWRGWGWQTAENDTIRQPNQTAYSPDGAALRIVAGAHPQSPPTIINVSACIPADLFHEEVKYSFPSTFSAH